MRQTNIRFGVPGTYLVRDDDLQDESVEDVVSEKHSML